MTQDIHYTGYSANPSDYESQDGELAMSLNLINEDGGSVKALDKLGHIMVTHPNDRVYIHNVGKNENFIACRGETLIWFAIKHSDDSNFTLVDKTIKFSDAIGTFVSVEFIGLVMIVSTSVGLHYIRYDAKTDEYIYLGSGLPDVDLDFALKLNFITTIDTTTPITISAGATSGLVNEEWASLFGQDYDVSYLNGQLKREWAPWQDSYGYRMSTDFIPMNLTLKPNVEYKISWAVQRGCHVGMCLYVYGFRNGSSTPELIMSARNEKVTSNSIESIKVVTEEWTGVSYKIHFSFKNETDPNCGTIGIFSFYSGVDNSETGEKTTWVVDYTRQNYECIISAVNKFVHEKATTKSQFIYPFFIRYGVRLFDGSYGYISEPRLMTPNSGYVPAISFQKWTNGLTQLNISAYLADIRYKSITSPGEQWTDIIAGVDIFVSQPLWRYNQSQEFTPDKNQFFFYNEPNSVGYGEVYNYGQKVNDYGYINHGLIYCIRKYAISGFCFVGVAPRTEADIRKDIDAIGNFYKIATIGFSDLVSSKQTFADLTLEEGCLTELVAKEPLTDLTLPYKGFQGSRLETYNNRLHITDGRAILRDPLLPKKCIQYTDGDDYSIESFVFLSTDQGYKVVRTNGKGINSGAWYFYPDTRAYKASFIARDSYGGIVAVAEIPLKAHNFLNGAYWYGEEVADNIMFDVNKQIPIVESVDNMLSIYSKVYTSIVNCPFSFLASNVVSLPAHNIMGLATAAKALSQGQFGQFPLYAFTDEGVWAMEVSGTGTYSAKQPITRDVCINPEGITQIDSAVLFPTNRGIMLISGSLTECISDVLNTATPFDVRTLPGMDKLHAMLGDGPGLDNCIPTVPFLTFLKDCRMIYDYVHQRIIVYNSKGGPDCKGYTYAYVYSLKSKLWGMMYSNIKSNLNSYPNTLAVTTDGQLVDFSLDTDKEGNRLKPQPGLLVTRPLKLGGADVMKTIDTVIQRGNFQRGHVQTVLYGSRNLKDWHAVWSSKDHYLRGFRGTPYKYFRIALLCNLDPGESIFGASINFNPRLGNQLR